MSGAKPRPRPRAGDGAPPRSAGAASRNAAKRLRPSRSAAVDPEPPRGVTATERVYDAVRFAILERRIAPGTWLREVELAHGFDVSRTVVRQALHRLAQDHVVELLPNRGARVPQPTREHATHVFEARQLVECEIARRLAGRLDPQQLRELRALVDAEARAAGRGDRAAAIRLSGQFHQTLAQMCGNPVFVRMVDELLPSTSVLIELYQPHGHPGCQAHRHVELIDALQRKPAGAAAEMRRHLLELQRSLDLPAEGLVPLRELFRASTPPARQAAAGRARRRRATGRR